jgi:hypothetical protein
VVYAMTRINFETFPEKAFSITSYFESKVGLYESILIQGAIQLPLLAALFFIASKPLMKRSIVAIACLDLILATQLSLPATVIANVPASVIADHITKMPEGFPVPPARKVIGISDHGRTMLPLWINLNMFYKETAWNAGISFVLKNFDTFERSILFQPVLNNYPAYLSDKVFQLTGADSGLLEMPGSNKFLFFENSDYGRLKGPFSASAQDTAVIKQFKPDEIIINVNSKERQILTLLQSDYPGWEVFVNDELTPHYLSNYAFMSVPVPAGESEIKFRYRLKPVLAGLALTISGLIFSMAVLVFTRKKKGEVV